MTEVGHDDCDDTWQNRLYSTELGCADAPKALPVLAAPPSTTDAGKFNIRIIIEEEQ